MTRTFSIVALLMAIAIAGAPILHVSKWIGNFTLTVGLDVSTHTDTASITYVACWNDKEAYWLVNDRSEYVAGFERPDTATPDSHTITIPCSGDSGGYGRYNTYHQPEFLVVQYRNVGAEESDYDRKLLPVPHGRGPRSTALTLP